MEKKLTLEHADQELNSVVLAKVSPVQIREQLEKVLSSRTFRAAEGQKALLRYVVKQAIQGRSAELKEYSVGLEAFRRGESFDPRQDTIVRTEARNVRLRLARYYAEEGKEDSIIIQLPKGGYAPRFSERVTAPSPHLPITEIDKPAPDVQPHALVPRVKSWRRIALLLAAVAIPACAIVAGSVVYLTRSVFAGVPPVGDPASIAVLPFHHLNDEKESAILSDGLTEDLINSLARIPGLHVVGRSSVFQYKGNVLDIRKAGRELGVRHVLEGSVRVSGGRVRISAQLEDTSNGYQLWSESFDRKLDDTLAIQGEISRAIMQSLGVELTGTTNLKTGVSPPPAVYQDYLKGLYFLNKSTAQNIRTAIEYFERAVASDPSFALAYRGIADGYGRIAAFTSTPSEEVVPKIRTAASKALELDDTLGEAHLDLARAYTFEWNWSAAEREFRRALDLSPGSAAVHRYYGDYLLRAGYFEEALAEGRIAMELDPISSGAAQFVARALYYLRRYDDAIDLLQKALALNPSDGILHQALGLVCLARPSTYPQGLTESEIAHKFMEGDPWTTGQLGYAYALTGKTKEAREVLKELLAGSRDHVRALPIARVYIGLGDRERALEWLQKAVDQHDVSLLLKADPLYDRLRGDERFIALRRQSNMSASLRKE
jgi:TolB-like protein/Tfp pilus assembly protein PilF